MGWQTTTPTLSDGSTSASQGLRRSRRPFARARRFLIPVLQDEPLVFRIREDAHLDEDYWDA